MTTEKIVAISIETLLIFLNFLQNFTGTSSNFRCIEPLKPKKTLIKGTVDRILKETIDSQSFQFVKIWTEQQHQYVWSSSIVIETMDEIVKTEKVSVKLPEKEIHLNTNKSLVKKEHKPKILLKTEISLEILRVN